MYSSFIKGFIFTCLIFSQVIAQSADANKIIRIAGYQMEVTKSISENKKIILNGILKAKEAKADFLVTPEGSLSGYHSGFDGKELQLALEEVVESANEAKVGLMLGTCYKKVIKGKEQCWNQIRVYTPDGKYLGAYSKILRCSPVDFPGTGEMLEYVEGYVRVFEWHGMKIGTLICNDFWASPGWTTKPNPYLPLKLKQQGAELIVHAINSGTNPKYKPFHESSVELWAMSLKLPVIEVNAGKGNKRINATSGLVNAKGERETIVPDTGTQFFVIELSLSNEK